MPPFREGSPSVPQQASVPQTTVNPETPPQEDTRWDIDKAGTVGRATYEIAEQSRRKGFGSNPFDQGLHFKQSNPEEKEIPEEIKEAIANSIAWLQHPFEKLYDLKPEQFSQIPLPEFIAAAREFETVERRLFSAEESLKGLQALLSKLQGHLEKRQAFYEEFWQHLFDTVKYDQEWPERTALFRSRNELRSISNNFDITPRQIVEEYIKIVDHYLEVARNYVEQVKRDRKTFLEKYGITEKVQEAPSA